MKYVIGVDFGTLSARALLVEADSGREVSDFVSYYSHGVLEEKLPCGKKLQRGFALQVPRDYVSSLSESVRGAVSLAGIDVGDVIGLCIDFTASTLLPLDKDGVPLCENEKYVSEPHSYVKLWKHHGAVREAEDITAAAEERGEEWLAAYGGKISSELAFPKILETLRCAPELYKDTYRFCEAADWISLILTGKETRSPAFAGYKAFWRCGTGYPSNEFFASLDSRLDGIIGTKVCADVSPSIENTAGKLNAKGAEITGLAQGTPLALPMIDAHASLAGNGVCDAGDMVMIIGTSTCHIINSNVERNVKGIFGYVKDGVFPGIYTYEAGQSGVGDMFDWFVRNCVPSSYEREAEERKINIHALLREKAMKLDVGESGLIALDWWSGNRSILLDSSLTGSIFGLTLRTRPEEIYRALIEATAFGTRMIVEQYEKYGVNISRIIATGGIANKDEMMMQIYADVLNRSVSISSTLLSGALGSAAYAAAAAGVFDSVAQASRTFARPFAKVYYPIEENRVKYDSVFEKYKELYHYFGEKHNG